MSSYTTEYLKQITDELNAYDRKELNPEQFKNRLRDIVDDIYAVGNYEGFNEGYIDGQINIQHDALDSLDT